MKHIFLDSQPLGLLARPIRPDDPSEIVDIRDWAAALTANGNTIVLAEIVDYELRRELLRSGKASSVAELDRLKNILLYLTLTTEAMLKAAELWAQVRRQGQPTASDQNIDVDVILAAQALTLGVDHADIVVATVNPRHLSRFVTSKPWQDIAAS